VAKLGYPASWEKNILAPIVKKTAEFEVKNKWISAEEVKAEHVLELFCYFFYGNEMHLTPETNSTKL